MKVPQRPPNMSTPPARPIPQRPPAPKPQAEPELPGQEHRDDGQQNLFDVNENWQDDWKGMPEYIQKEQEPFHTIHVHFNDAEAIANFGEAVKQKVGQSTKFMWFPEIKLRRVAHLRYVSEGQNEGVNKGDSDTGACIHCGETECVCQ
jgi:hypothetical protein